MLNLIELERGKNYNSINNHSWRTYLVEENGNVVGGIMIDRNNSASPTYYEMYA